MAVVKVLAKGVVNTKSRSNSNSNGDGNSTSTVNSHSTCHSYSARMSKLVIIAAFVIVVKTWLSQT